MDRYRWHRNAMCLNSNEVGGSAGALYLFRNACLVRILEPQKIACARRLEVLELVPWSVYTAAHLTVSSFVPWCSCRKVGTFWRPRTALSARKGPHWCQFYKRHPSSSPPLLMYRMFEAAVSLLRGYLDGFVARDVAVGLRRSSFFRIRGGQASSRRGE
ncbi:hypothetical protein CC80DRAFT_299185 [Byssothecium circinans]|uniref:Uncharacterized protein n=1 Tax=Byssothecium circinans TaxID=147558 RepID=A0A6A5T8Y3_9PLEO|nr:hypothetical protein CC80DRAFT_299185 [Byssothecium circinans]